MLLNSLFTRKKQLDASPKLRRIMDMTMPNRPVCDDSRSDSRYNRSLPALVIPMDGDVPVLSEGSIGIIQNLSDRGLNVLLDSPTQSKRYLVSLVLENDDTTEVFHFNCEVRNENKFAGTMASVGLLVAGCADVANLPSAVRAVLEATVFDELVPK